MSVYEFSTNDGSIKGKVHAYTREEAAQKAFTALSHRIKNNPDYDGMPEEIILKRLTFDDPPPQLPTINQTNEVDDFICD